MQSLETVNNMLNIAEQMKHIPTREWHDVVFKYAKLSNYQKALDIGTGSGLSAYSIANAGTGIIVSVDILTPKSAEQIAEAEGFKSRVTFLTMDSATFWIRNSHSFDFICIDGSHKKADVFEDAEKAWKFLNQGGYIVFDDYAHPRLKEDVGVSVDAFAKKYNLTLIKESGKAIVHKV